MTAVIKNSNRPACRTAASHSRSGSWHPSVTVASFAARWLAYAHPCRHFIPSLAADDAQLRADAGHYSFIAADFHRLLLAGLPAHPSPYFAANPGSTVTHARLRFTSRPCHGRNPGNPETLLEISVLRQHNRAALGDSSTPLRTPFHGQSENSLVSKRF